MGAIATLGIPSARIMDTGHSLLIVEDPMIANLVRTVFRRYDYVVVAVPAMDAIERLRPSQDFHGILVTNTPAYFVEFAETLRLLYLSSSPDPEMEALFRYCRVVRKPFTPAELVRAVNELAAL